MDLSNCRSRYRDLIKQYGQSKDCGNQTSLVSSLSAGDKDPNETVIDTGNGAVENAEENVEFSSSHFATQGSRKQPSIANLRSSRRRQVDEMELKNLRAEKETEQRLRERQLELEQEHEEMELCRRKEQQEQDLRLKLQKQQEELRLRQHERELENERKKAEADEEQSRPLSANVVIDPPKNVTQERGNKRFSAYPKTTSLFQPGAGLFSAQLQDSSILKKPEIPKSIRVT